MPVYRCWLFYMQFREEQKTQEFIREDIKTQRIFREELKTRKDKIMDLQKLLGDKYKDDMTVDELKSALADVNVVTKAQFDSKVSELNAQRKAVQDQLNEKLTEAEKKEAEYNELKREKNISDLEKQYLNLGYDAELAHSTAIAQLDGDTTTMFANQQKHNDAVKAQIEAKFLENTPNPPAGASGTSAPQSQQDYVNNLQKAIDSGNMADVIASANAEFNARQQTTE